MQTTARTDVQHPLEPLTADEIRVAAATLRRERQIGEQMRFVRMTLREPRKEQLQSYAEGEPIDREAFVILRDRAARTTYEAVVSIGDASVRSWRQLHGVQPPITYDDFMASDAAVRADPQWQAAMRKRGVTNFDRAMVDPWSNGYYGAEDDPSRRLTRSLTWIRSGPEDNGYARPIEGLLAVVDLDEMKVVRIEDHGVVPLPPKSGNYSAEAICDAENVPHFEGVRADLKPVQITQPEGTSFNVRGHEVSWQKWRFRIGFTPREGLVLHMLGYEDHGRVRPILYRASLSEMLVPYGDPQPTHWRKNAFDEGEYGMGMLANALELGCDCLGEICYFDAVLSNGAGEPVTLPNAICMHEEDVGLLWKHTDFRTGRVETRRSRRLVVSSISTVGNYEYGFFWYFYQDGSIEFQVKMTGIISTGALAPGETSEFGTLVAPGLYGPNHQHFFNVRLDMTVDGPRNSVYEINSEGLPRGPQNPHGNAWVARATLLEQESQAQRVIDPLKARYWNIVNTAERNGVGKPVAYKLVPGENVLPFHDPESSIMQRAGFTQRHLWVTRYDEGELFAAGDYPNQHLGGAGLPAYAAADRSLRDEDVVVWYTMGAQHVVRPEDWPVMPVSTIGFQLKPNGFFDGNPALDVAPPERCH
jgi:primary-amine oxidase